MTVREFFERFGVSIGVVAVLTLLVLVLPGDDDQAATTAGGPATAEAIAGPSGSSSSGAPTPGAAGDATAVSTAPGETPTGAPGSAPADGGGGDAASAAAPGATEPPAGANCRDDGRNPGISFAMPPCVPVFDGDNGGATARGVTADKIIVARYIPQSDPAASAALTAAGASDSAENVKRQYDAIRRYGNWHFETYGREVVYVDVEASGPDDNDAAMRADAIRIAEEVGAFAAMLGTASQVLAEELGARDVTVVRLTAFGRNYYKDKPKRVWASLPTTELYYVHTAEYIGKRLHGRNAAHAGDENDPTLQQKFKQTPRKFGLVWIEGVGTRVDPEYKVAVDFFKQELSKYGAKLSVDAGYTFDLPRQQQQSTNIISKMRAAGVSNITFIGDPLYPAFLTREATRQNYYPEWLITGTLLTDTTFFGRTYDQVQWGNAFGISPLWVFWENKRTSAGYREFFHMNPDLADGEEGVAINTTRGDVQQVFIGVHMAGPNLTPDTFAQGMLDYPATGGDPAAPLLDYDEVDPNSLKDFTEVWWDSSGTGKDEADQEGLGILMKVDGGARYRAGEWPTSDPKVFVREGAVYTTDTPAGISNWPHEQDGHTHPPDGCRSCG